MKKQNRVKVGLFVTISFFVLVGAIGWLAGSRFFRAVDTYQIHFTKSVSGLLPGARVEYQGVTVGRVAREFLTTDTPPKVVVTVELKTWTPVRRDTYAQLKGSLVTGIRYIELGGGKDSMELQEGGIIPVKDEESIEDITDRAGQASEVALALMKKLQKDVLTDQNLAALGTVIQNVAAISTDLRTTVAAVATPKNQAALGTMLVDLSATAAGLRRVTGTLEHLREDVPGMADDAKLTLGEAKVTLGELRKTIENANVAVGQIGSLVLHVDGILYQNQGELGRALAGLSSTARELNETLTLIRYDPARLVWGSNLPARKIPDGEK